MRRVTGLLALAFFSGSCLSSNTPEVGQGEIVGQSTSVTKSIGPNGDSIAVSGATVTVPKGALTTATDITISTNNGEGTPAGYIALSSIFHGDPSGTTFAQPVTMKIPFNDDGKGSTMFWSSAADPDFSDVGGTVAGGVMTANVSHFSSGFVGRKRWSEPVSEASRPRNGKETCEVGSYRTCHDRSGRRSRTHAQPRAEGHSSRYRALAAGQYHRPEGGSRE